MNWLQKIEQYIAIFEAIMAEFFPQKPAPAGVEETAPLPSGLTSQQTFELQGKLIAFREGMKRDLAAGKASQPKKH
jgi:hypothetical protein